MSYHYPDHVGTFIPPPRGTSDRIAQLVSRYPGISEDEAREIVTFIRTGRHLDVGMLTMNEHIRPKLDAFMQDHKSDFRVKWWETALVTGGIAAAVGVFWVLRELFA
jgi:hypothetical protein